MAGNRGGGNARILHPITETPYDAESGQKTWVRGQNYSAHLVSFAPLPNDTEREIIFGESVPAGSEEGNEFERSYSAGYMADWDIDATRSLLCERVVSILSTPPTNPLSYERYIVGPAATDRWSGFENHLAFALPDMNRRGLSWVFRKPLGDEICVIGDTGWYKFDGLIEEWVPWPPNTFQQLLDTTGPFNGSTVGYVPTWDGTNLVLQPSGGAHSLGSHTDTVFGSPGAGEDTYVVSWDAGTSSYVLAPPPTAGPHTIGSHSDANVPAPTDKQVFSWDTATSKWVARTILLTDLIVGGIGTAGQVLTSNGTTASFQTPATAPASSALFGVGIRHPLLADNQAGNQGNANYISSVNTAVCQARWSNPVGIMESTAGLGYGNIKVPIGFTKARFYCRIRYFPNASFTQWQNLQFCVVKKNPNFGGGSPSLYLYHPFGLFGGSDIVKNTRQFPDGNFCWPWDDVTAPPTSGPINLDPTFEARLLGRPLLYTDQVYIQTNGFNYESLPVDVTPGTVYAIAAKWTIGPPTGGAGASVSGGAGNGQAVYIFDEWGCYLYA